MLLGIDIGTTKVAAVITNNEGSIVDVASREHKADLPGPEGHAEQDVRRLLDVTWEVIRQLPAELRAQVQAIGVTGQMHGVALLDAAGEPLTPLITWQDRRSTEEFLTSLAGLTGYVLHSGYGCATLAWLAAYGHLPPVAAVAATIHDLAVARLCGQGRPVTDPTDAASWGLFDLPSLYWDLPAVQKAGIPPNLLPVILPCGSRAGVVDDYMASLLGLPAGIPVTAAIGDNQASLLATLREPGQEITLTIGTGAQVSVILPPGTDLHTLPASDTCEYRPFPGQRYAAVGASLSGGACWAWLADTLIRWQIDLGLAPPPRDELFSRLNTLGLAAEDTIRVEPHFLGERYNPALRGSIIGIDLTNGTLGSLARSLARGLLENLHHLLPSEFLANRTRLIGSGNALRRNPLLQAMAEEVFGLPLLLPDAQEEAARGAAMLAGGVGPKDNSSASVLQ